ncbi:MAG: VOC family protein [Caulobacteraceae bacterium]
MSNVGKFTWYELMTTDAAAAAAFYGKVVGWTSAVMGSSSAGTPYTVFSTAEGGVAGLMETPKEATGMPPGWMGYISVDDVDDYARRFEAAGGAIHRAPADIPDIGRFSVVGDPQGAVIVLFKALPPANGAGPPSLDGPGYVGWRELLTTDGPSAMDFYGKMFGWDKSTGHDMGQMGVYQLFAYDGADRGGIMTRPAQMPVSVWGYYFGVDAIGAATERLKAAGGTVLNGPMQVPTGDWIVQGRDPQGAAFNLQSPNA